MRKLIKHFFLYGKGQRQKLFKSAVCLIFFYSDEQYETELMGLHHWQWWRTVLNNQQAEKIP
jgi:hypothetical protein